MTVSNHFIETSNTRSSDEVYIILITIEHESLTDPIRICNDTLHELTSGVRGVISNDIEYVYVPFEFILPSLEQDSIPQAKMSIDNISREITAAVEQMNGTPTISIQIVLSKFPDIVEYDITGFTLSSVTFDAAVVEGDLTVEHFASEPYPAPRFTPGRFPGLYRGRSSQTGTP